MCIYSKLIRNKKYEPNKKNGGNPPPINDPRKRLVPKKCGKCIECMKTKARDWQVRLHEEIRHNNKAQFVTLTFSNEEYKKLHDEIWYEDWGGTTGYKLENRIATLAIDRFLERWRKKHKKFPRHWLVTELGHNGTENIHLHGLIWTEDKKEINDKWKYGYTYIGYSVNESVINYIIKYVMKIDQKHKEYIPKVYASKGIGKQFMDRLDAKLCRYKGEQTREYYTTRSGQKLSLPIYYRNKLYTEEERENLWTQKLNKEERWVLGQKIDISENFEAYNGAINMARHKNKKLGYGNDDKNWDRKEYEERMTEIRIQTRLQNAKLKEEEVAEGNRRWAESPNY